MISSREHNCTPRHWGKIPLSFILPLQRNPTRRGKTKERKSKAGKKKTSQTEKPSDFSRLFSHWEMLKQINLLVANGLFVISRRDFINRKRPVFGFSFMFPKIKVFNLDI